MATTILRLPDVIARTGLGKTQIYALEAMGLFPKRIRISERAVGWYSNEIDQFIESRPRARAEGDNSAAA
jgi:prophage regulatory protein